MSSHETHNSMSADNTTLGAAASRRGGLVSMAGGACFLISLVLWFATHEGFNSVMRCYLTAYGYVLSLSLGALFLVLLQHATRAGWSVSVRRVAELMASTFQTQTLLFVPILVSVLLGSGGLYPWADAENVAASPLLQHKAVYLNGPFFAFRAVFYFAVWWWLARRLLRLSVLQDTSGDPTLTQRMERMAPLGLLAYAFTVTFAAFDWFMSLTPEWFSTIYGLYYFSGALVGSVAMLILILMAIQATGRLVDVVTIEHYHDLGKLLFAFVIFWGYIAFSQYMLIWYANIPEETTWYLERQSGGWQWASLVLLVCNLFIPFLGLISRTAKRCKAVLAFWAIWLLAFHWLDLYWLVVPGTQRAGSIMSVSAALMGIGLVIFWLGDLLRKAAHYSLLATGDPRLHEALEFENH